MAEKYNISGGGFVGFQPRYFESARCFFGMWIHEALYHALKSFVATCMAFLDLYLGYILVCTECVCSSNTANRVWTSAGKF